MSFFFGILIVVCVSFAFHTIGSFLYRPSNKSSFKKAIIQIVLGAGISSYLLLFLGLISTRIQMFLLLGFVAIILHLLMHGRRIPLNLKSVKKENINILDYLLLIAIALLALGHFLLALSPTIAWDAATHHYLIPKIWLQTGKIIAVPEVIFSEYPSAIEILYMMGIQLGGIWVANVISWMISVLLGLAIYGIASEKMGYRAGLIAVVVFFTMPLTIEIATGGMVDIGYTLFCIMAFWLYLDYRETGKSADLIICAIFAGFAFASKHLAWEFLIAFSIGVIIHDFIRREFAFRKNILNFASVFIVALLIAFPWYLKSFIHTGNPIHPFLPGLFYSWREVKEPISVHAWSRPEYSKTLISFLTYPWKLTTDFKFIDFWVMGISPLFLGTIPLWWLYRKNYPKPFFMITLLAIVVFMIMAFRIAPSTTRYMLPLLCLLSFIAAGSLAYFINDIRRFGKAAIIVILLIPFMFTFLALSKRVYDILPVLTGHKKAEELYRSEFDGYTAAEWINENLPIEAVVLTTDPKAYFLERKFYVGTPGKQSQVLPPWSEDDSEKILEGWKELGITHLLFNLSRNVMKNSYFVYTVTKGIERHGELLMTAEDLADLTKLETEFTYSPSEIAEFGRVTQTPTKTIDGMVHYHLYPEWWEKTVQRDRTQYMLQHYLELRPHLNEIRRFKAAVLYEIYYDKNLKEE